MKSFEEHYRDIVQMNRSICNNFFYDLYSFKGNLKEIIAFLELRPPLLEMKKVLQSLDETLLKYEKAIESGEASNWWHSESKDEEICLLEEWFHLSLNDIHTEYLKHNHQMLNALELEFSRSN